jgi:hypothetical protein
MFSAPAATMNSPLLRKLPAWTRKPFRLMALSEVTVAGVCQDKGAATQGSESAARSKV